MTRESLLQSSKPILFNTEMVRAILDGRKTVTRRCVKPQPEKELWYCLAGYGNGKWYEKDNISGKLWTPPCHADDILYVRETWSDHYVPDEYGKPKLEYCYKADGIDIKAECLPGENNRWYPSIHMPKEAARIFLKVTDVRVERLQDITAQEAISEGEMPIVHFDESLDEKATITSFIGTWNSTIKKSDLDTYGWEVNPWVWVIEFEKIEV